MPITTLSSREFNQDRSRAKRAADQGPVFITDRGRPALVLLSFQDYTRLTHSHESIGDQLSCPQAAAIDLDIALIDFQTRPAVFD